MLEPFGAVPDRELDAEIDAEADKQHRKGNRDQVQRANHQESDCGGHRKANHEIKENGQDDPWRMQSEP